MKRLFIALACCIPLEIPAVPIVWVKVTEPMGRTYWSHIPLDLLDIECASDQVLPRVCLYRRKSACRIITDIAPAELSPRTVEELNRMCTGYFPEPVLLQRKFSDPDYLPNQAPPSADPAWKFQNEAAR